PPGAVAMVVSLSHDANAGFGGGDRLSVRDRLQLKSGECTLRFFSGATVVLAGPAELEVSSGLSAILHRGRLTARVEKRARGFTIVTRFGHIIDLGTRFGVDVGESGDTDIVVFEGQV